MEGIEKIDLKDIKIANQLDLRIKLLGISELKNGHLFETVHPCLVNKNSYIGNVTGVMNAVILEGKPVGESILQGEGAGPGPTSSALLSDLLSILRGGIKNWDIWMKPPWALGTHSPAKDPSWSAKGFNQPMGRPVEASRKAHESWKTILSFALMDKSFNKTPEPTGIFSVAVSAGPPGHDRHQLKPLP